MNNHTTWLANRKKGIGGSDVAAVLGLSPWKTPLQVYQEKRSEGVDMPDTPAMFWGRSLEPLIRQKYADETGKAVQIVDQMLVHPQHDFMLANLDGITHDKRVLEIKTARTAKGWGEEGSDEIPQPYLLQVQHYLAVTGFDLADVAVLIGGSDFRLYEVAADKELQEMMINAERAFWLRVKTANPPEPINLADMQRLFGQSAKHCVRDASQETLVALNQWRAIKTKISALEEEEEAVKALVMKQMGEADTLSYEDTILATWRLTKSTHRFDAAAFKVAHPALYQTFLKEAEPTRRLLLK